MDAFRQIGRWWTAVALLASVVMLAAAHAFERIGGYPPCALCLEQREVYWFAILIALPATLWTLFARARATPRLAAFLLFAVFTTGAIVATFHAGGELKWWSLPATCGGGSPTGVSLDDLTSTMLGGERVRAPACDVAAWTFAGVSMAGWNAIVSVVLALASLAAARIPKELRRGPESVIHGGVAG